MKIDGWVGAQVREEGSVPEEFPHVDTMETNSLCKTHVCVLSSSRWDKGSQMYVALGHT